MPVTMRGRLRPHLARLVRAMLIGGLATAAMNVSARPAVAQAAAESWPQRGVKFILPLGPGSASDIGARLLAERLQARWGKPITIENRPGGDGLVALGSFVTAKDDHVLFYGATGTFTVHPYQHETLPYDVAQDLLPIASTTITVVGIGVPASMGVASQQRACAVDRGEPCIHIRDGGSL